MPITTLDGLLEAWADGIETMEQNLEALYGPPGITPVLPAITTEDGMLEALAEETEKTAWGFAKLYNALSAVTDNGYSIEVPDTAMYYGMLSKIGGNTVVSNGEMVSAAVTQVVSKDAAGNVIDTLTIPAEVQALTGYGWGTESQSNYIDFVSKKFVQNVTSYTFTGSEAWSQISSGVIYTQALSDALYAAGTYILSDMFTGMVSGVSNAHITENACWLFNSASYKRFHVYDTRYDKTTIKAAIAGSVLYYPLATPIETDISAYIDKTDIKIQPGGTLTFVNANEMDVPSEVEYMS